MDDAIAGIVVETDADAAESPDWTPDTRFQAIRLSRPSVFQV